MDLRESTGLPIVSEETALKYSESEISVKDMQIIKTEDVSKFLLKDEWEGKEKEKEVYRIYQKIRKVEDKHLWDVMRFDFIVLQPGKLGEEYHKTIGYYRSYSGTGYRFPEVYQVVEGYSEFFLQQFSDNHEKIKDAVMIRAQKFDVVVVPPSYGVTVINPSEQKTVLARIRSDDAKELMIDYEKTKGECYVRGDEGRWKFNENYFEIPNLRLEPPQNKWRSLKRGIPIYSIYIYKPKIFAPLLEPDPADYII
jgi:oxalate decarboxylase/phosphoglucose isomerase-like protein (cupin superfamily)